MINNILGCIIFIKVYSLLKLDRFKIEFKSFNIIYPLIKCFPYSYVESFNEILTRCDNM